MRKKWAFFENISDDWCYCIYFFQFLWVASTISTGLFKEATVYILIRKIWLPLTQVFMALYFAWLECSPMARETWVQSQVESYQRLKKWYLMAPCLTLSIIRYGSRVKWSNPGKGVEPSPTPWCSKLSKREPSGHPRLWSPTLLTYVTMYRNGTKLIFVPLHLRIVIFTTTCECGNACITTW